MSHAYLDALALEFSVEARATGFTREQKAINTMKAIAETVTDQEALTKAMVDLAGRLLAEPKVNSFIDGGESAGLIAALELDGYTYTEGRVSPHYGGPVAPTEPASWLEIDLARRGLNVAGAHFRQAVDNFERRNWEACNGQLRAFMEELLLKAGNATGKDFKDPTAALQHLYQTGIQDTIEYNTAKALWAALQHNGAHAGLSDEDEALYRLHSTAAWARYVIKRGVLGAA
jgi:hypothetical protein